MSNCSTYLKGSKGGVNKSGKESITPSTKKRRKDGENEHLPLRVGRKEYEKEEGRRKFCLDNKARRNRGRLGT